MDNCASSQSERPTVFFRFDANATIASGHLARCSTLMGEFERRGVVVKAIVSDEDSARYARTRAIEPIVTGGDWRNLGVEIPLMCNLMLNAACQPLLILDTYSAHREYVDALSNYSRVVYFGAREEDLGALWAVVDYSVRADLGHYRELYGDRGTHLMIGPTYAPLSPTFRKYRNVASNRVEKILITTGGSDKRHIVPELLKRLLDTKDLGNVVYEVVVGAMFDNKEVLLNQYGESDRVYFHTGLTDLSSLMKSCDLCISACGTTIFELASLGVPSVVFPVSSEQHESSLLYGRLGVARSCFADEAKTLADEIVAETVSLCSDKAARLALSYKAHSLVDGMGAERIVDGLLHLVPSCEDETV